MIRRRPLAAGLRALALALGLVAAVSPLPARAQAPAAASAPRVETALNAVLARGLEAFNRGDFPGYLADFEERISYNGLDLTRARMLEINQDLKQSFPNLRMAYTQQQVAPLSGSEARVMTSASFDGETPNYDHTGLPATYHEEGEVSAFYHLRNGAWKTDTLQVSSNDSYIEIGRPFGLMGFSNLPVLLGAAQPYPLRFWVGAGAEPGGAAAYAYVLVPLRDVINKAGADKVFAAMKFQGIGLSGVQVEQRAPSQPGTYAHVLVVNRFVHRGEGLIPVGQKVYTRLVRVD